MELFGALLDSGVLIPGVTLSFGFFVAYLLLSAKHVAPLTIEEIETLWKFINNQHVAKQRIGME